MQSALHQIAALGFWLLLGGPLLHGQVTSISTLDVHQTVQSQGQPRANRSADNNPITLCGRVYHEGLGTIAPSRLVIKVANSGVKFSAVVGVDDEVGKGNGQVVFKVFGDKKLLWQSATLRAGDEPQKIELPIAGFQQITLQTEGDANLSGNHADWADAQVELFSKKWKGLKPNTVRMFEENAIILTPKPGPKPRITGAKIFGVRPGRPVLYTITATGVRPMEFSAVGLPEGLKLDPQTGQIRGSLMQKGEHLITVRARNAEGEASRPLKLVCGDRIGLVPAMGWNSWNCFAETVSAQKIRDAVDALVNSGLIHHGWSYVNIDEGWSRYPGSEDPLLKEPVRDANGRILPNGRFPDMAGLVDYIHSKGLRAGIYTSPGPLDCGGFAGSYQHELLDAQQFAEWGFDYLKYDVCSYNDIFRKETAALGGKRSEDDPAVRAILQKPWKKMRASLDTLERDIVYSISGNVRDWGREVGANSWRVSSDVVDSWMEIIEGWRIPVSEIGFDRVREAERVGRSGPELAGPGHYNDRDMLVVGYVGWGAKQHPTNLTPNEQYSHISIWSLLASPLILGCDMTKLDEFTISLLSNDDVLEVNQDPLGKQAVRVAKQGDLEVWAKEMEDGSKAVGLFNRGYLPTEVSALWKDLGITGTQKVRDLWRQQDLGDFNDAFVTQVPRHGVVLVRMWSAANNP